MIEGIGIDIVEIKRIEQLVNKSERFPKRILNENELIEYSKLRNKRRKYEYLAGRFAAKEAFSKALGTGIGEVRFKDIEISSTQLGAPLLRADGYRQEQLHVSISHSELYAVAQVIITN